MGKLIRMIYRSNQRLTPSYSKPRNASQVVPQPFIRHMFEASDSEESAPRTSDGHTRATMDVTHVNEADKHFVDAGPSWEAKSPTVPCSSPLTLEAHLDTFWRTYHL